MTAVERLDDLMRRYAEVPATSPEALAMVREIDELKRDVREEQLRARTDRPKPRGPWRGRVADDPSLRPFRPRRFQAPPSQEHRQPSPRQMRDHQAAAANDVRVEDLP